MEGSCITHRFDTPLTYVSWFNLLAIFRDDYGDESQVRAILSS